jgi:hypothetical protein
MVLRIVMKKIAAGRQQGSDEHGSVHQWAAGRLHSTIGICERKGSCLSGCFAGWKPTCEY